MFEQDGRLMVQRAGQAGIAATAIGTDRILSAGLQMQVFCRIDYHLATPKVASCARAEHIYLEQRFSDHAPLVIDYDFTL